MICVWENTQPLAFIYTRYKPWWDPLLENNKVPQSYPDILEVPATYHTLTLLPTSYIFFIWG